uniref:Uncharacterized protein n=1 Tax=viral metagenome TaxID=1070528 RepID=A0A6C0B7X1_9ZZZZ
MEPPPSYRELLFELININTYNLELELQVHDLKQELEKTKQELEKTNQKIDKINNSYIKAKQNEVLLTSILQGKN